MTRSAEEIVAKGKITPLGCHLDAQVSYSLYPSAEAVDRHDDAGKDGIEIAVRLLEMIGQDHAFGNPAFEAGNQDLAGLCALIVPEPVQ